MKTKSSIKNSMTSMIQYLFILLIGFISQKIFINILGVEYLGLNGLFTNIISILGIVELGVGNAIIYNLYKPLVNKDYKTVNSLMKFYRNAYNIIAIIILILGICLLPFLGFFIGTTSIDININLIYILFILEIVVSYLLSYKRSILYADQKNYIINIIHIVYYLILNVLQLLYLYLSKDYYGYLIIKIIMRLIENVTITIYVDRKYKYLNVNNANKLDENILSDIVKKVKALLFHKIGTFIVLGTDNIIISKYLGIITVGLYSNYYLVIDALNKLFGQAITALTPSVGHLLVEKSKVKNYEIFKKIRFINFWIATFVGVGLLVVMQSFITIWLGKEYLLGIVSLIVLVINFYQKMMRNSYAVFKEAAGIYYEDRFVPIIESITNIVVSIILVKLIGLPGVFIGTIVSGLWLWCFSYPKYIYKKLFGRNYINYAKETIGYISLFGIIATITYFASNVFSFNNIYLSFIYNMLITLIIPNLLMIIVFYKSDNFGYYIELLKKIFRRRLRV